MLMKWSILITYSCSIVHVRSTLPKTHHYSCCFCQGMFRSAVACPGGVGLDRHQADVASPALDVYFHPPAPP